MTSGARAIDRESRRGRHRLGAAGATWTPAVPWYGPTQSRRDSIADTGPIRPVSVYAWPETPATGLRKFNLGTIPASVTPPRTWRRAAWFAVGTAVFVVLALCFAALRLVGNPRRSATIDALPGQPSQQLLITDLPAQQSSAIPPTTRTTPPTSTTTTPRRTKQTPARPNATGRPLVIRPDGQIPVPQAASDQPSTSTPPARSTIESLPEPPTDPDKLGDRTEQYYAHVADNPAAACALTTGEMQAEGPGGIAARYPDVQRVEVKEIVIDPNWSYTRSVLTVVHRDGTTTTVRRELTFSPGDDPKISSDNPAS